MSHDDTAEIRFAAPLADVAILDGVCHASGSDRTHVMQGVLHEWAERELHRATVVVRMAHGNALAAETHRQTGGT